MNDRILNPEIIAQYKEYLVLEERSSATIEKYVRDVKDFALFVNDREITKETVIAYKKSL